MQLLRGHDCRNRWGWFTARVCFWLSFASPAAAAELAGVAEPSHASAPPAQVFARPAGSLDAVLLASADEQAQALSRPGQVFAAASECSPRAQLEPVHFERGVFSEGCVAPLAHFDAPGDFSLARFEKVVDLSGTSFASSGRFRWTVFGASARFAHARFAEEGDFYGSHFQAQLDFYGGRFEGAALFHEARFQEAVDFSSVEFRADLSFYHADFRGPASFKDAEASGNADFSSSLFHATVDFSGMQFKAHANFARARFRGLVSFFDIHLPATFDLSGVTDIEGTLDLVKASPPAFDKKCRINLIHSDLDKINIDLDRFQLEFPSDAADRDIVDVYEGLLNNFERRGLKKSFRAAAIEFERYKYARDREWFLDALQRTWWDYGFEKQWIFRWIAVLLLSFTLINNFFFAGLLKHAYVVEFLLPYAERRDSDESPVVRFVLNLPLAFLYTSVIFFGSLFGFRRELNQFKSRQILINVYLFVIMASGIVCTMFILNFIMK